MMGQMQDFTDQIDAAEAAYGPARYRRGHDYLAPGADHKTFSIDVGTFDRTKMKYGHPTPASDDLTSWHDSQIQVHGDESLRNRILNFLTASGPTVAKTATVRDGR